MEKITQIEADLMDHRGTGYGTVSTFSLQIHVENKSLTRDRFEFREPVAPAQLVEAITLNGTDTKPTKHYRKVLVNAIQAIPLRERLQLLREACAEAIGEGGQ